METTMYKSKLINRNLGFVRAEHYCDIRYLKCSVFDIWGSPNRCASSWPVLTHHMETYCFLPSSLIRVGMLVVIQHFKKSERKNWKVSICSFFFIIKHCDNIINSDKSDVKFNISTFLGPSAYRFPLIVHAFHIQLQKRNRIGLVPGW